MLNMTHSNMPEEMTVKNLTLFASEVIPRIRTRTAVAP